MNRYDEDPDATLDRIVSDIRKDEAASEVVSGAADRVWASLGGVREDAADASGVEAGSSRSSSTIRGCAGFQALMPSYVAKALPGARALLLEDHVRDCATCRGALDAARGGRPIAKVVPFGTPASRPADRTAPRRSFAARGALAAAASLALVLVGLGVWRQIRPAASTTARVHSLHGTLYRVADGAAVPIAEGVSFRYGEEVRTAKDSGAVIRLADGSLVEMSDRAEMSVGSMLGDTTIRLPRGNIIVQATKRASGHLFVQSDDALVSVTGTIFSVSHGTKGSRVSVIEGEVHVDHAGAKDVLHPGQQMTTQASLMRVPVEQDISWSRDVDRYITLLRGIKSLREDLAATHLMGNLRYSTRLLDAQPEGTMFFAAIPNISGNLAEANRKIQENIAQNEVLRDWLQSQHGEAGSAEMDQVLEKIRAFGSHLGDEVTVSLQMSAQGEPSGVLLMSEVNDPEAFGSYLADEVSKANAESKGGPAMRILPADLTAAGPDDDADSFTHGPSEIVFWIHGDRFVAASSVGLVRTAAANLDHPEASAFTASSFRQRIADSYKDGAGWLFCLDMEKVVARAAHDTKAQADGDAKTAALQKTGILDARHFILEVKESSDRTSTRGVLSFDKERRGIASWLAAPAPMGALDFMSPDATLMTAFVVKEPVLLVDDLFGILSATNPDFGDGLATFESKSGVSIKDDLAAPLGGEFAFALDGPVLPVPSWKAVVEVYDPPRLQRTIELIIAKAAERPSDAGGAAPTLEREDVGGRTFYTLRVGSTGVPFHYTYVDGYLLAAPQRSLLERAIQNKESGYVLAGSQTFRDLLPQDGRVNFSALVYQNVGPLLKPLAQQMSGVQLTPEQRASVAALSDGTPPSLAYAYGEQDRIIVATSGAGSLASQLGGAMLGVHGGDQSIAALFEGAIRKQSQIRGDKAESAEKPQSR